MNANSLSKDTILSLTNSKDIYTTYLGLSEFPKGNISSPFATDKNPSFKINADGYFKCFSTGQHGDVWQFVADVIKKDCKTEMQSVLQDIAKTMNLSLQSNYENKKPTNTAKNKVLAGKSEHLQASCKDAKVEFAKSKLQVAKRPFTNLDLDYWSKLGVNKTILEKFDVFSISEHSFDPNKPFKTKEKTVSFAYEIDGLYKKYTPEQPEFNIKKSLIPHLNNVVFGLKQLPTGKLENLIICEGEKDVIVANSRGFYAVTFGSATNTPKDDIIALLQSYCNNLLICYDNDESGDIGRNNIIKKHGAIISLQLPSDNKIKGYDVTDYLQDHTAQDFQKIIDLAVKNKSVVEVSADQVPEDNDSTIFHKAEFYIKTHYDLRFDIIANEIEISKKDMNTWSELNDDHLYVEMQKKHIKISIGNLRSILLSDFVPKFNPLQSYFDNLPLWDGKTDYIKQYSDYLELETGEDKEQFVYHLRKWLTRSVKCSTTEGYYNKQAFVLSDDAKGQNIGKTTYIRFLVPSVLNKYYCENLPEDKDALKRLGQNFIINLDELATLSKTDINKLKSMFSSDKIKTRLPYGKKDVIISRVANFIGSTNMSTFLVDESGSVRWLCFIVKKINFDYSKNFSIDNLWSQALALSKDNRFQSELTPDDVKMNEIRNEKFQILSPERESIPKYFEVPISTDKPDFMTSTDILNYIATWSSSGVRFYAGAIGKALPKCGFLRVKNKGVYGYWVIKKPI